MNFIKNQKKIEQSVRDILSGSYLQSFDYFRDGYTLRFYLEDPCMQIHLAVREMEILEFSFTGKLLQFANELEAADPTDLGTSFFLTEKTMKEPIDNVELNQTNDLFLSFCDESQIKCKGNLSDCDDEWNITVFNKKKRETRNIRVFVWRDFFPRNIVQLHRHARF